MLVFSLISIAIYHDEYSKLFNDFVPFVTPDSPNSKSLISPSSSQSTTSDLLPFNESFISTLTSPPPPSSISTQTESNVITSLPQLPSPNISSTPDEEGYFAISIIKRRRKKMNKHKYKKV